MKYDVIVVGAGAAGLFAAGTAAEQGASVCLAERNPRPGRKVMITGKGRCNVTNNCTPEEFLRAVRSNAKFLYGAAYRFPPERTMEFFEGAGVPLKTERGGRVFPVSDRAVDIVDALAAYGRRFAQTEQSCRVEALMIRDGALEGVVCEDGRKLFAPKVIVATGGLSYPGTGSTGDGYRLARQAGHTVIPPEASLIPVETQEEWCRDLMGLSLKNVTLTVRDVTRKKEIFSELGEMLFTHFGVSGPLVLSASSFMKAGRLADYRMEIDLKPALTLQQLDDRIRRDFVGYSNRDFFNALSDLLPRKLIPPVVRLSGIPGELKVHQVTREQRLGFARLLKCLPLTPKAFRPVEEAIITAGGVKVSEVDPKTMESKLLPGLYFAGEVLDVDACTGGYNLQIAFSTGYLAGQSAAQGK